jgi:opacity protein-like surface antigen
MTLSLAPLGIPVSVENQYLYNRESDPTGFGREFKWQGGFGQVNWQIAKKAISYGRYDWVSGNRFDDTTLAVLGLTGVTKAKPREWDVVAGLQYLMMQNLKLIGEYRHHEFSDSASTPNTARLQDDGFTIRAMIAF